MSTVRDTGRETDRPLSCSKWTSPDSSLHKKECNVNTGNLLTALENLGYWKPANKPKSAKIIYLKYLLKGGQHWLSDVYKENDQKACFNF